jgi:hypothetical protein
VDYDGGDQHYLLEYGRPQGVLRHANILGQLDRNPAATAAATKVKLAKKAHVETLPEHNHLQMEPSSAVWALAVSRTQVCFHH